MSSEDKYKLDHLEESGPGANNKVAQINTTTDDVYRLLFSETADDTDRTEKSRKSANLTFNPSTGVLNLTGTINANGGTLTGVLTLSSGYDTKLILDNTDNDSKYQYISFRQNGTEYGTLGTSFDDNLLWNQNYILHSKNYSNYALPLTGGTLTQTENKTSLLFKNTNYDPYISFQKGNTILGHIIVNSSGVLQYHPQSETTYHTVIHSGNYHLYALPITGGSIKSSGVGLRIKRTGGNPKIAFYTDETLKGYIGYDDDENPIVHPASGSEQIIIHSGNIGSQSVGTADKLKNKVKLWG